MGYFRDDAPLYELMLDEQQQKELDELWRELDFVASANIRTYVQFYLFETRGGREGTGRPAPPFPKTRRSPPRRASSKVAESYLARARASKNEVAIQAVEEHFKMGQRRHPLGGDSARRGRTASTSTRFRSSPHAPTAGR